MGHHQLDTLDEQILKLIADNARIPFLEVARACNVSGAAIHQRIQKLTNLGILKGSEYVIDPEKIGYETCAYIGIYLKDPASFDAVTRALEAIPEIVECHFTTGKYDMFIKLYEAMRKRFAVNTVKIVYLKKRDSYRPAFIHIEKVQIDIHIVQNHENGFLLQKFVEKC